MTSAIIFKLAGMGAGIFIVVALIWDTIRTELDTKNHLKKRKK